MLASINVIHYNLGHGTIGFPHLKPLGILLREPLSHLCIFVETRKYDEVYIRFMSLIVFFYFHLFIRHLRSLRPLVRRLMVLPLSAR